MKKNVVHLMAIALLFVFIFSGVLELTVNAEEYDYEYIDTDANVLTVNSFENTFSSSSISKVMYDYYVYNSETDVSIVVLRFTMRTGNKNYTAIGEGMVKSYSLPSGETLIEGPIDGNMSNNNNTYKLTIGFARHEGTGEVMISATMKGKDGSLVAFAFGENIIKGEILDLFMARTSNYETQTTPNKAMEKITPSIENSPETMSRLGDLTLPLLPYDPPEGDDETDPDLNVGANGEYKYQSAEFARWNDTTYKAFESNVYFCQGKQELLVMLNPHITDTQKYVNTLNYDAASSFLYSVSVNLSLDPNATEEQYARIEDIYLSGVDESEEGSFEGGKEFVIALISDYLSYCDIPSATIEYIINNVLTSFDARVLKTGHSFSRTLLVDSFVNDRLIEEASAGLAIRFLLSRPSPEIYEGNTSYTVTATVKYSVITQTNIDMSNPIFWIEYIEETVTHIGTFDL